MASIQLDSVSINFPIYNFGARSLKKKFLQFTAGGILNNQEKLIFVQSLDKVTLKFNHGDRVVVIDYDVESFSLINVVDKLRKANLNT